MRVEHTRPNLFRVTATGQELSALVGGARMALDALRSAPDPPPEGALAILQRVIEDYDRARERLAAHPPPGADPPPGG